MAGIFKKLSANDIKITPFEAHKQYSSTNLASIGVTTSSIEWAVAASSSLRPRIAKWYQIDKLYYRDYIGSRIHRLELNDANYTKQERRLYATASIISISQNLFGNEVQPETFEFIGGGITIKDDGYGNLYDNSVSSSNFPQESYRLFYLGPVNGFKNLDLNINPLTGNNKSNPTSSYSKVTFDDSYARNIITYTSCSFQTQSFDSEGGFTSINPFPYVYPAMKFATSSQNAQARIGVVNNDANYILEAPGGISFVISASNAASVDVANGVLTYVTGGLDQTPFATQYVSTSLEDLCLRINNAPMTNIFYSCSVTLLDDGERGYLNLSASIPGEEYNGLRFLSGSGHEFFKMGGGVGSSSSIDNNGYLKIQDQPYFNPKDKDFSISFYIHPSDRLNGFINQRANL